MNFRLGEADKLFEIQNPVVSQAATGIETEIYQGVGESYFALESLSDREALALGRPAGIALYRARGWWTELVTKKSRLTWNNRTFSVISVVNPREDDVEIEVTMEEIRA